MTKQDFLEGLRGALSGRAASGTIAENLRYYEDYINTEVRKGKREEEVLAALGDPRLLARTIIETKGAKETEYAQNHRGRGNDRHGGQGGRPGANIFSKVPALIWLIVVILIVILILSAIFSVIAAILPVVLPILLVLLLVKVFRDWVH